MPSYSDPVLKYLRLLVSWPVLASVCIVYLVRNPKLIERIVSVDVAGVKVQLSELQTRITEQDQKIENLDQDLSEAKALLDLAEGASGRPVLDLQQTRADVRQGAAALQNVDFVTQVLTQAATPDQIYTAAQVIRARPEPKLFVPVVSCLSRLSSDANLQDVRPHFVYQLVQALHRLLVNDQDHSARPLLSREDLVNARLALQKLWDNPRVVADEEKHPGKSIRRPTGWCLNRLPERVA